MCLCVICCHPIYSGRQTCRRTSRGHTGRSSPRISPPFSCGACLNFYREKDSTVPFLRRPWSRILCTYELIILHLSLGIIFIFYFFRGEKSQCVWLHRDSNSFQRQKVSRLRTDHQDGAMCAFLFPPLLLVWSTSRHVENTCRSDLPEISRKLECSGDRSEE